MAMPRITCATPQPEWPILLTCREPAVLLDLAAGYVSNQVYRGRMWPPPVLDETGPIKPIRFSRDVVAAFIAGKLPRPARRRLSPRLQQRRAA